MSVVWTASIEAYRRIIAEKKHMRDDLEAELAMWNNLTFQGQPTPPRATWYTRNQVLNINRQIEDLEDWLKKLEEKEHDAPSPSP